MTAGTSPFVPGLWGRVAVAGPLLEAPLEMRHRQCPAPYASEHEPLAFSLPKTYCSCSELLHSEICQGSNMNH